MHSLTVSKNKQFHTASGSISRRRDTHAVLRYLQRGPNSCVQTRCWWLRRNHPRAWGRLLDRH